jgi:hypothetical protein
VQAEPDQHHQSGRGEGTHIGSSGRRVAGATLTLRDARIAADPDIGWCVERLMSHGEA